MNTNKYRHIFWLWTLFTSWKTFSMLSQRNTCGSKTANEIQKFKIYAKTDNVIIYVNIICIIKFNKIMFSLRCKLLLAYQQTLTCLSSLFVYSTTHTWHGKILSRYWTFFYFRFHLNNKNKKVRRCIFSSIFIDAAISKIKEAWYNKTFVWPLRKDLYSLHWLHLKTLKVSYILSGFFIVLYVDIMNIFFHFSFSNILIITWVALF